MRDGHGLHPGVRIGCQTHGTWRQVSDFVVVADKRIEHRGLALIERMTPALASEKDLTRYSHFAALGVCGTASACSHRADLRGPTRPETGDLVPVSSFHEFDLRYDVGVVCLPHGKAGAGPGQPVVLFECSAFGQADPGVCGINHIYGATRTQSFEHLSVKLARRGGTTGRQIFAACTTVTIDHQKTRFRTHCPTRLRTMPGNSR